MAGTRKQEQGAVWINGVLDVLKGSVLGAGVALAVLLLAACLIWMGVLDGGTEGAAVKIACAAGAFAGGLFALRRGKLAPLPGGLGVGAVLFLLLLAGGAVVWRTLPELYAGGVVAGTCLCGGGLAGVLGRWSTPKKRRRR